MLKHVIDLNRDYSHHIITDTKEMIAVGHDVENAWKTQRCI